MPAGGEGGRIGELLAVYSESSLGSFSGEVLTDSLTTESAERARRGVGGCSVRVFFDGCDRFSSSLEDRVGTVSIIGGFGGGLERSLIAVLYLTKFSSKFFIFQRRKVYMSLSAYASA